MFGSAPPSIVNGPDLFRPRVIRVVSGIMKCIRCDKALFHTVLQAGWAFQECQHSKCSQTWWSLAIPPDAPVVNVKLPPADAPLVKEEVWVAHDDAGPQG